MAERVFLVEDHPVSRRGQTAVLESEINLEVCGEAASASEALQKIPESDPDIVLVDLSLEEGDGLDLIKALQTRWPELPLLVVSMHDAALYAQRCIQAGARGYLMKQEASDTLVEAVQEVLEGRIFLCEEMKEHFLQILGDGEPFAESPLESLSDRELQVFERLGRGQQTEEIAEQLNLSPKTVYSYQSRIKDKLGLESTAKLRQRAAIWTESFNAEDDGPQS